MVLSPQWYPFTKSDAVATVGVAPRYLRLVLVDNLLGPNLKAVVSINKRIGLYRTNLHELKSNPAFKFQSIVTAYNLARARFCTDGSPPIYEKK